MKRKNLNIGFSSYYKIYNYKNSFLNSKDYAIGDNLEYPFVLLHNSINNQNATINTLDIFPLDKYDKVIFADFPSNNLKQFKKLIEKKIELYLIIFESELIRPGNWNKENHRYFKRVFTWHDEWTDGIKYIKYCWPNKIPEKLEFDISKKEKLFAMIAGNKMVYHDKRELYSERIKAIRWFEQNHPEEFDLHGIGWDEGILRSPYNIINRSSLCNKIYRKTKKFKLIKCILKPFHNYFPSYRGRVVSKKEVYSKYKFAICYENAKEIPGYITEKIFDCFFAGCVPVYWGAPNVTEYIPENTFIDKRNFETYEELYSYLKNMTDKEYSDYLCAIKDFIGSDKIYPFSAECFADTIIENIMKT